MAKVTFASLGAKDPKKIETIEFNGKTIEIKTYLPIEEKINSCEKIGNASIEDTNYQFVNFEKFRVLFAIEVLKQYTNITFTEKQMEKIYDLYDACMASGLYAAVTEKIPESELKEIWDVSLDAAEGVVKYMTSAAGIVEKIATDSRMTGLEATETAEKLTNKENLEFLTEVLSKLS